MTIKLEVGKTYVTNNGTKVKIVSDEYTGWHTGQTHLGINVNGKGCYSYNSEGVSSSPAVTILKECKEPVIHKIWIIFAKGCQKNTEGKTTQWVFTYEPMPNYSNSYYTEFGRKYVEYVEE